MNAFDPEIPLLKICVKEIIKTILNYYHYNNVEIMQNWKEYKSLTIEDLIK